MCACVFELMTNETVPIVIHKSNNLVYSNHSKHCLIATIFVVGIVLYLHFKYTYGHTHVINQIHYFQQ